MQPVRLFPDLPVTSRVGNELIAFVSPDDPSIDGAMHTEQYRQLADRVRDLRGDGVCVGLLVVDRDQIKVELGATTAFRNIVAISAVCQANLLACIDSHHFRHFLWSDYFRPFIFSFFEDGDEHDVIGGSPSFLGIDDASTFMPMSNANLSPPNGFDTGDLDKVFYNALMDQWLMCFLATAPDELSEEHARLFRSLEMAFIAAGMPFDSDSTPNDYGTRLSLWVSAIEIIVAGGFGATAEVLNMLGALETHHADSDHIGYVINSKGKAKSGKLLQHLYQRIYDVRNDFLHGNNVSSNSLSYWSDGESPARLGFAASLIYRIVVLMKLGQLPFATHNTSGVAKDIELVRWRKWFDAVRRPEKLIHEGNAAAALHSAEKGGGTKK